MPDEKQRKARAAFYDQHLRNPEAKRFYDSALWKATRSALLADHPVCQRCEKTFAQHVHHVIPLAHCTEAQKTDPANLLCVCVVCHSEIEAEVRRNAVTFPALAAVHGVLHVEEDETYFYDADAAEHPIRFIEKYCTHTTGDHAGKPFILLDWQRQIIRTLFGWKRRDNGRRRFRELYLLSGKGTGKTPLLAAIGLYLMIGAGEAGAHVISMASSFEQANYTFGEAKKYIEENPTLQRFADPKQFEIRGLGKRKHSRWKIISGKPKGRSGSQPNCIIADECHEWEPQTAKSFDTLAANTFKRSNPLVMIATNAAESRTGFAWQMHERAVGVLAGTIKDDQLLPVIFAAPPEMDWRSEEAARLANPSIGHFRDFEQDIKPEQTKGEARYRRLFLSQFVAGSDKWITLDAWDACTEELDPETLKTLPLYVGIDASGGDDLFAAIFVWVSPDRFYVDARFWLPRTTAEKYADSHRISFKKWEEEKAITLLDEVTINTAARQRIAAEILEYAKPYPFRKLAYDRAWKAEEVVEVIRATGIECEGIGQGWGIYDGAKELDIRLADKSITVTPNPVLRWNAENVELAHNTHGAYWPVKPNAKGNYAGRRSAKIDGISGLCTALTEARKHSFPKHEAIWQGSIFTL